MNQLTIYLDETTQSKIKKLTKKHGLSLSKWLANLIHKELNQNWPEAVVQLAGAWADFPSLEEIRANSGCDVARQKI